MQYNFCILRFKYRHATCTRRSMSIASNLNITITTATTSANRLLSTYCILFPKTFTLTFIHMVYTLAQIYTCCMVNCDEMSSIHFDDDLSRIKRHKQDTTVRRSYACVRIGCSYAERWFYVNHQHQYHRRRRRHRQCRSCRIHDV